MKILLNESELSALAGLSHLAVCLYVMAIRTRMDYITGMVGDRPRVSWQAFREWCYVEPRPGVKGGSPHASALRRAAVQLERVGLIRSKSSIANAQLRFFLPLASLAASVRPIKSRQEPDRVSRQGVSEGKPPKADRGGRPKADIHRSTGTTSVQHHNNHGTQRWEWADSIGEKDRSAIARLIATVDPAVGQQVIDELVGAMQIKNVSNKVGYVRALVAKAIDGAFQPEQGNGIAEARERRQANAAAIAAAEQSPPPAAAARDLEKGRARMTQIRSKLKRTRATA